MRTVIVVNQDKLTELNLTLSQGALLSLFIEFPAWAQEVENVEAVRYAFTKQQVFNELPLFYPKQQGVFEDLQALYNANFIKLDVVSTGEYEASLLPAANCFNSTDNEI